jgi:hypothetical protein
MPYAVRRIRIIGQTITTPRRIKPTPIIIIRYAEVKIVQDFVDWIEGVGQQ